VYRELTSPSPATPGRGRLLTRSALGVTAITVVGWIWRWNKDRKKEHRETGQFNGDRD
jgi:hypothetical protein